MLVLGYVLLLWLPQFDSVGVKTRNLTANEKWDRNWERNTINLLTNETKFKWIKGKPIICLEKILKTKNISVGGSKCGNIGSVFM